MAGHPLKLLGNGGEEVAEPEVLGVVAAGIEKIGVPLP